MVASRRDWYHRDIGTSELEQGGLRRFQRENLESIVKLDEETESINYCSKKASLEDTIWNLIMA